MDIQISSDALKTFRFNGHPVWFTPTDHRANCGVRFSGLDQQTVDALERLLILDTDHLIDTVKQVIGATQERDVLQRIVEWFSDDVRKYLGRLTEFECRVTQKYVGRELEVREDLRKEFAGYCDYIIEQGERKLPIFKSRRTQKLVKHAFRKILIPWTRNNPFIERCLTKPRGYPGDYMMMEMGYGFKPNLEGGLSGFFDRYFSDVYECVRCRKDVTKSRLRSILTQESMSPIRVLSMGGGPCREWFELESELPKDRTYRPVHFACLDQDSEALNFARAHLAKNKLLSSIEYVRESLLNFSTSEAWTQQTGTFDFIYGMGIANYFYDETLVKMLNQAFRLLRTGGELIVEHKDRDHFRFAPADWLCNWTFVKRNEDEFSGVFTNALQEFKGSVDWRVERDKTGELVFGVAKKT